MFGIGFFEAVIIGIVALVFVGPKRLPEVARQLGRFFVQIRRATTDVRQTVDTVIRDAEAEIVKEERDKIRQLLAASPPQDSVPSSSAEPPRGS